MASPDWRRYQNSVAEVFRSLGADVAVEHTLSGVRAQHEVDVYVGSERWGVRQCWIIECKLLKRAVTKAHVLTLKGVLDDVGADRAVLVSDRGFQPGAVSAAAKSNVSLTSLSLSCKPTLGPTSCAWSLLLWRGERWKYGITAIVYLWLGEVALHHNAETKSCAYLS